MKLKNAVNKLRKSLKEDDELYYGYQSNIAMAFYDEAIDKGISRKKLHEISNNAAKNFINLLIRT